MPMDVSDVFSPKMTGDGWGATATRRCRRKAPLPTMPHTIVDGMASHGEAPTRVLAGYTIDRTHVVLHQFCINPERDDARSKDVEGTSDSERERHAMAARVSFRQIGLQTWLKQLFLFAALLVESVLQGLSARTPRSHRPLPSESPPLENAHPSAFKRIAGYIAGWKHRSDVLLGLSDEPRGDSVRRKGQTFGYRAYNGEGKLHSEELRLPNGDDEWKTYDGKGVYSFDERIRNSD